MTSQSFIFERSIVYYKKTGSGPKVMLAFHGFGQDSSVFNSLSAALSNTYTYYAVDLFFHAKSEWGYDEQPLEKDFLKRLLMAFLTKHSIDHFSVLGFSMGGKFALAATEAFPGRVNELFLLAPDGIKTSMWYSLATYPVVFRKIFKSMIEKPDRFNIIANFAFRAGLIDKGILRFVESQMNTEEKRSRVYRSWVVFRHLKFNLATLADSINRNKIRVVMIVGKFDKIITAKNMNRFLKKVTTYQLEIPETGHNGVIEASIEILKKGRDNPDIQVMMG